ncbi:MAG: hydratase, partial [Clostridia bacterium]|nr:hydratase [Clostridia bacterium]
AVKPGDGSAREQAASCQKVLGGWANIANEYATKRYRSNLINWGMMPFTLVNPDDFDFLSTGALVYVPGVREGISAGKSEFEAIAWNGETKRTIALSVGRLTDDERQILLDGCLINYYAAGRD